MHRDALAPKGALEFPEPKKAKAKPRPWAEQIAATGITAKTPTSELNEFLKPVEAAAKLELGRDAAHNFAVQHGFQVGATKKGKVGGRWRIPRTVLEKLLKE